MLDSTAQKINLLKAIVILAAIAAFWLPAIPQDPAYHHFADQRRFWGLPHFWNVVSNLPFIAVGLFGINALHTQKALCFPKALTPCYWVFFIGVGLVGVGSSYYHASPDNITLVWDRLPMTIAFMAFTAIIVGEYISEQLALRMFGWLLMLGLGSVIYWDYTERLGQGDLRWYGLVQFVPMVIIPLIMWLFPARFSHTGYLWGMLLCYLFAKVFEAADGFFYDLFGMGGHAIKHILAAAGPYLYYIALSERTAISSNTLHDQSID